MKIVDWDIQKNKKLLQERGIFLYYTWQVTRYP